MQPLPSICSAGAELQQCGLPRRGEVVWGLAYAQQEGRSTCALQGSGTVLGCICSRELGMQIGCMIGLHSMCRA